MILLGLLLVAIVGFAFGPKPHDAEAVAAGAIWVALSFVTVINLNRAFTIEREADSLKAVQLTGIDSKKIFASKFLSSLALITLASCIIVPAALFIFNMIERAAIVPLTVTILIGAAGYSAVGVMLAAMSVYSNSGEGFLTIILFPMLMPIIMFGVKATKAVLLNGDVASAAGSLAYMIAYDVAFAAVSLFVFDRAIEE
jgi:heme exporter protein B